MARNMEHFTENCMVCGKPLVYCESAKTKSCYICGAPYDTNAACEDGHYVCDGCHAEKGVLLITLKAGKATSRNPIEIATDMMRCPEINMHGPEHHYLAAAALLAAYKNAGGTVELKGALLLARQRAKLVPGGICGLWGSCGAGIATGIFVSIITGATPLSEEEWSMANRMTSRSLAVISQNGGPRCCKRNVQLAIYQAADFVKENFNIALELPERVLCEFFQRNKQCKQSKCMYYAAE